MNDKKNLNKYEKYLINEHEKKQKEIFSFLKKKESEIEKKIIVKGEILNVVISIFKNNKIIKVLINTFETAFLCFLHKSTFDLPDISEIKKGNWFKFTILENKKTKTSNNFNKNYKQIVFFEKIEPIFNRKDNSIKKRIEFHVHTKMSALDGVGETEKYIKTAIHFGHKAIAFTDHENVHVFAELSKYIDKYKDIKLIFGCEFNFLNKETTILSKQIKNLNSFFLKTFVFFDIETTGLSRYYNEIIEFAALVVKNGIILKKESFFIKIDKKIPDWILELTGINYDQYKKEAISKIDSIKKIKEIFKDYILVAHNVNFDISFINKLFKDYNEKELENPFFDTLKFSYYLNSKILKSHNLRKLARYYKVRHKSEKAHRAFYDVEILNSVFLKMVDNNKEIDINHLIKKDIKEIKKNLFTNHINILVKNQKGIKNIYKLVSISHTETLYKKPTLEKKTLEKLRDGLLIGAGCYNSEVFDTAILKSDEELEEVIKFYDFIEVQPLEVYSHLVDRKVISLEDLKDVLKRIIRISEKLNKIIIASGDVHYIEPKDKIYRDVFISTKQLKGSFHHLNDFKNRIKDTPNQHFRTTQEMIDNFSFLNNKKLINKIVIENTEKLSNLIQENLFFEKKLNLPEFENADKNLKEISFKKLKEKYGSNINEKVLKRFNHELDKVIEQKFSSIYLLAYELTDFSLKANYLIGSRGSVGSSFLAYCLDITEVNPLEPHYYCKKCFYFEWTKIKGINSGFDLPKKKCINCNFFLESDGQKISFESFLGIDGKSVPDIDLNFSGKFQEKAIKFVTSLIEKKIGKNKIFRAGTISTVAFKSAFAYLLEYLEKKNIENEFSFAEKQKIINNCLGVKKTTGQHPGGLIIIPKKKEIFDFTPFHFPSNDCSKAPTTHFDYHVLKNKLLKLDVLGHDDPTALKILSELTGVNLKKIPFNDSKVIRLFSDIKVLKIQSKDVFGEKIGTIGLPEFGTPFVRKILRERKVLSFSDLISVSGLSHGTNVWESNAQDLLNENQNWTFNNIIACRDDIMQFLINWGFSIKEAYKFMIIVKKGKGLSLFEEIELKKRKVPFWFINSCKKISYMFPKAHATAYVIMAYRFAWFKIYYPFEFYSTYFSIRTDVFDLITIYKGENEVIKKYNELNRLNKLKNNTLTTKDKKIMTILEVAKEMLSRGIKLELLSLKESDSTKFIIKIENGIKKIIPPLTSIDGFGIELAKEIIKERKIKFFKSLIDLKKRTKINKTVFETLEKMGVLKEIEKIKQSKFNF